MTQIELETLNAVKTFCRANARTTKDLRNAVILSAFPTIIKVVQDNVSYIISKGGDVEQTLGCTPYEMAANETVKYADALMQRLTKGGEK